MKYILFFSILFVSFNVLCESAVLDQKEYEAMQEAQIKAQLFESRPELSKFKIDFDHNYTPTTDEKLNQHTFFDCVLSKNTKEGVCTTVTYYLPLKKEPDSNCWDCVDPFSGDGVFE